LADPPTCNTDKPQLEGSPVLTGSRRELLNSYFMPAGSNPAPTEQRQTSTTRELLN